jgi:pimeloyl-ACP methyl ester carboxylesterase
VSKKYKVIITTIAIVLVLALLGFIHVRSIATGSEEASVPEDCEVIRANGFDFSVRISGNNQDTPVLLLHGFPESSAMWTRLMSDLNNQGYYTIAPDQRGYSAGARPRETDQYHILHLEKDVLAIADALNIDTFHLIAHDWGSAVGWELATKYPERILSYSCLSVPHLSAFARAYDEDEEQYEASDYMRFFQTKWLPEYVISRNDYQILRETRPSYDEDEMDSYLHLFRQKRALTSAINWYRANFNLFSENRNASKVAVPTLFIWGNRDIALKRSGAEWTKDYVSGYYKFLELDAGHWLIQEAYDTIYSEVMGHLRQF